MLFFRLRRGVLGVALLCAGCAPVNLDAPHEDLGDFRLGHAIVLAGNAKPIPPSRRALAEEWETVLREEITTRFGGRGGRRLYHIAVNVDGYALAVPGVPVVAAPKSVLVISANLWDDAAGRKLHDAPEQIVVFEDLGADTLIGTGLTRSREEQMRALARNAALQIERWLARHRDAWLQQPGTVGDQQGLDFQAPSK
ncbi:hypothetical protein C8N32_10399 [Rhodovulum imhoffii]|uniref:LPS-assembly lipoprotein n=1 Tax=Rhodovulum imhoffii TaxID=365340 RepID=A0A2T5BUU4_9RHOB|nr:hypothetical protein [Rhodovulum imhoffii]MBK5934856.1 hypothetical protein [Rhodovulum imhoffii]PTN03257.1 hypothetical protein C8N32_10399 [Rhodovulum imhoffii]